MKTITDPQKLLDWIIEMVSQGYVVEASAAKKPKRKSNGDT